MSPKHLYLRSARPKLGIIRRIRRPPLALQHLLRHHPRRHQSTVQRHNHRPHCHPTPQSPCLGPVDPLLLRLDCPDHKWGFRRRRSDSSFAAGGAGRRLRLRLRHLLRLQDSCVLMCSRPRLRWEE